MATRILNGGLELAILESIEQDRKLTESEKLTKEKLDFLQKGEWVYLDDKANPISQVDFDLALPVIRWPILGRGHIVKERIGSKLRTNVINN